MHEHMWMQVLAEARGIRFPRSCSYKCPWAVLHGYWELNFVFCLFFTRIVCAHLLQEQHTLLTTEQSLFRPTPKIVFPTHYLSKQYFAYNKSTITGVWTSQGRILFCNTKFPRETEKSETHCDWGTEERLPRVGGYEVDWPIQREPYSRKKNGLPVPWIDRCRF